MLRENTHKEESDQQSVRVVKQALKDDQALSLVAGDIHVTVEGGAITLEGKVATKQQMNLAANTAAAAGVVDNVDNRMEVVHKDVIALQPVPAGAGRCG